MRKSLWISIFVLAFLVLGCSSDTVDLAGRVVDQLNAPLSGIQVTAVPGDYTAQTDASGNYAFSGLPLGRYVVTAAVGSITNSVEVNGESAGPMSCGGGAKTADDIQLGISGADAPPTVTITKPFDLTAPSSWTVLIQATASDDKGVVRVVFYIDGVNMFNDTAAPYNFGWNTTGWTNAAHTIRVVAYDTLGQTAEQAITVNVYNTFGDNPPHCSISNPADGATVSGLVTISATMDDDNNDSCKVIFYIDGVSKSTATSTTKIATYGWNTTTVTNGSHAIRAEIIDIINQRGEDSISVTVSN
jgi:large repetitive protein